jgi:hypothetical protein
MAAATKRSASTKQRASGNSAKRGTSARKSSQAKSRSQSRASSSRGRNTSSSDGSRAGNGTLDAAKNVVVPVATAAVGAAAGVVGGFVFGRRRGHAKKVLGVRIPGTGGRGMDGLAKEVRKAGKQFGHLASEVKTTRKKAEDVGKALS